MLPFRESFMALDLQELENEATKLPLHDRALLIEHLIASLDSEMNKGSEEKWLREAERRYQSYQKGKISTKSAIEYSAIFPLN